jgi:hypothetical protein
MLIIRRSAILASMFDFLDYRRFYVCSYMVAGREEQEFLSFVMFMIYDFMRDVLVWR